MGWTTSGDPKAKRQAVQALDLLNGNTQRFHQDATIFYGSRTKTDSEIHLDRIENDASRRSSKPSLSRQTSGDMDTLPSGVLTPMQPSMSHIEYCADDLARVPSYPTALQSQPNIPIDRVLPSYRAAIRTPDSSPPLRRP